MTLGLIVFAIGLILALDPLMNGPPPEAEGGLRTLVPRRMRVPVGATIMVVTVAINFWRSPEKLRELTVGGVPAGAFLRVFALSVLVAGAVLAYAVLTTP
jgi:hypothetical protein